MQTKFYKIPSDGTGLAITTIGGTGSAVITNLASSIGWAYIRLLAIKTPGGNPTYDIELTDADSFGLFGATGLKGKTSLATEIILCQPTSDNHTVTISNATVDGTYTIRLYGALLLF